MNASNLYERGELLASLSTPIVQAGASLLVVDHFNKTGSGRGLDRITQAGVQEWSDTWLLLSHREPPDVEHGHFRLTLEIGSRQWGWSSWDLDLDIGRFDHDLGEFDGAITRDLARAAGTSSRDAARSAATEAAIITLLNDRPYELTEIGGNKERARAAVKSLFDQGRIIAATVPRHEGNRDVCRARLGIVGQPAPTTSDQVGPGSRSPKQMRMSEGG